MSYRNILETQRLLEGTGINPQFANKANQLANVSSGGTNPYSSQAYQEFNYRDLVNQAPAIIDERDMYNQMSSDLSIQDKLLMKGSQGLQGYTLGSKLSPYIGKGLTGVTSAITGTPMSSAAMQSFNLGPAAAVYSAFGTDNNPYTFTKQEMYGGTASNLMAAHQLSKAIPALNTGSAMTMGAGGINPWVMAAGLLFSWWNNKRRKKKAQRANQKVAREIGEQQTAQYEDRVGQIEDFRDTQLAKHNQQMHMDLQSQYANQYGGNYGRNLALGKEGMKFTPKELDKIAKAGRYGDTMLAHINPQEAAMLRAMGGSGSINPYTGLPEYWGSNPFSSFVSSVADTVGSVLGGVSSAVSPVTDPIFDAAGGVVNTAGGVVSDVTTPIVETGFDLANTGVGLAQDTLQGAGDVVGTGMNLVGQAVEPVVSPIMGAATDIVQPVMEGVTDAIEPIAQGGLDMFGNLIEGTLYGIRDIGHDLVLPLWGDIAGGIMNLFGVGGGGVDSFNIPEDFKGYDVDTKRAVLDKPVFEQPKVAGVKGKPVTAQLKGEKRQKFDPNIWAGFKENELLAENILEETDYADKGMKYKYYSGGKTSDIVAEFTGNELIVNDQDKVEQAIASGNYRAAAAPIRRAMKNRQITPGPETHDGNPMPVDKSGTIYTKGGKLKFKVKKGAGIYDHATDQFKPTMTDKEIAMTAYKNMAKWKSNGMA